MAAARKVAPKRKQTSKKSTSRKAKQPRMIEEDIMVMESETSTIDTSTVKKMSTKRKIAILVALIVIGAVLYLSRGLLLAASVNGQIVYRPTVISELEKRGGKQQLDSLITEILIQQEAKKKNINVTDDEVNAEITKITDSVKAQGQDINTLLSMQGMTQDDLKKQIKTQKIVEKILADKVTPTDQEISDFLKTNKDSLPKGQTDAQNRDLAKSQLTQQKLSTEFQTWLTEVKKNASIKYFTNY